ncbi:biliverdin-producing heme oxygenase [Luteibacter aegosomatis]|uniref:biliverdin-producing heme oxygenase n=1 Tax=Luteibacter aegosomatis TaxID=2911537 RepID=UPI001FF909B1|nr:biliverdin-producing heme oxygenase [Luteibacter aegosomatis]UPG84828.1 biliverdin-producing heme oxygenase [Luteibacter aegosomatis]
MDGDAASTPAHRILRERTRDAHEAVEAAEGMRRLMDGRMDEAGYEALLAAQWGLFRAWEHERAGWLDGISSRWLYTSRLAPLDMDLAASPFADGIRSHPLPEDGSGSYPRFPRTEPSEATFWGELYVVEGSTLGARLIVKHLRERFPAHPHRYYALGETTPARWRRFQSLLDAELKDDDARHHAVEGAHHMFARFRQALQDPAAHV